MGILLGEEDNTPDWAKELEKIAEKLEDIEEITFMEEKTKEQAPMLELNYDITLEEEEIAFKLFQKLYVFKSNIIKTIVFGIVAAIFVIQIALGKGTAVTWGLLAVCIAMIVLFWITPIRIRKMLMVALEALKDDRYIFRLFEKKFEIEIVIPQEDEALAKQLAEEDNDDENDSDDIVRLKPEKSVYEYPDENLRIVETDSMILVFVSKETFHIIPKRILSYEDSDVLNKSFISKFENYLDATSK